MDKESNSFTMMFAAGMCVVLAVLLAGTFTALKPKMDVNVAFDRKINVLIATGLHSKDSPKTVAELNALYDEYIVASVLEVTRGEVSVKIKQANEIKTIQVEKVTDMTKTDHAIGDLPQLLKAEPGKYVEFYMRKDDAEKPVSYCIPISGMGLWGILYGYLALQADCDHVQGITFYQHKETPGLGGEVDRLSWQAQWKSKKIFDDKTKEFVSVVVKKGFVDGAVPKEAAHMVDGLSGATITCNGVTKFVRNDLEKYEPYFAKLR